ncbi:RNA polymerase factor sigma-70 [Paludibacterium sp. THUN1379]|uniref:sigma-70 family RNA polymerase sigma factor n=1 Tax=Paludibacterium sp. THUN1379 TaxID=3112107 RepID=UPI003084880D|nr:RNA polymerase factor sigma-70 [Paludibacterium sp. THUN1379]
MTVHAEELEPHRQGLLRYALFRLRDEDAAHDLVQETFVAALEKPDSFAGNSALATWLTGILKHKLLDAQRRQGRELTLTPDEEEDLSDLATLFDHTGHWGSDGPRRWQKPESNLEDQQFWQVFRECSQRMPPRSALVFTLREVQDMEIGEICQQLEITASHCSVLLYRARMSLRLCLEKNWFGETSCD